MPVKLFSGLPGASKTAQMVWEIVRYQEQEPDRPRYHMGINGLLPSLATELTMEQLEKWWELPEESVIFIDEAQEDHLMPTDSGKPKEWVKRIRKVRHEGMDFVLTVQHPCDLSASVRRLVDQHVHTVRKFNTKVVQRYTWGRCIGNPENERVQRAGIESLGTLPAETFDLYVSSQSHNMKVRIPKKVYYFVALAVVALGSLIAVPYMIKRAQTHNHDMIAGKSDVVKDGTVAASPGRTPDTVDAELRHKDFAKWSAPRVAGLPWTAPMFDHLQVNTQPRIFCMAVEDGRCGCITEQGTKYEVPVKQCRLMVANGVYNPFAGDQVAGEEKRGGSDTRPQPQAAAYQNAPLPADVGEEPSRQRATARPYIPPTYGAWDPESTAAPSRL